jgi:hypothetical protein
LGIQHKWSTTGRILQKYHTVAPKKNTGINSKGFTSLDGDMMIQWRRSFEVHESFAKTIGRHIWVPLQLRSTLLLHEENTPKHVIGNENFTKRNNWDPN